MHLIEFLKSTYEWYMTNVYSREEFQIAGLIFWCVVSVGLWWRNNSFTREARIAEEHMKNLEGCYILKDSEWVECTPHIKKDGLFTEMTPNELRELFNLDRVEKEKHN